MTLWLASLAVHSVAVVSDAVFCVIKGEISLLSTVFGINNRRGRQAGRLNALQNGNNSILLVVLPFTGPVTLPLHTSAESLNLKAPPSSSPLVYIITAVLLASRRRSIRFTCIGGDLVSCNKHWADTG